MVSLAHEITLDMFARPCDIDLANMKGFVMSNANRTHVIEMNETQMLRIARLLAADKIANPNDYADDDHERVNSLAYLADCFMTTIATTDVDYKRDMLHGFTL